MSWPRRLVATVLVLDLLILLAYAADTALGHPVGVLESFFDLDREQNLPTWWSSAKLLAAGLVLGAAFLLRRGADGTRAWLLAAAAVVAMGLSLDETALLHERLGIIVLPYDRREGTLFAEGGAWMMLLVPAAIVGPAVLWRLGLRDYLRAAPVAAVRMGLGLALFVAGAAGVELLRGVSVGAWWHPLQVLLEEGLEFLGATLILWGVLDLARALGIRVTAD